MSKQEKPPYYDRTKAMTEDTDSLEQAFEKVLDSQHLLLTGRQQAWQAFKAGAEWAMEQVKKNALKVTEKIPDEKPPG